MTNANRYASLVPDAEIAMQMDGTGSRLSTQ